MNIKICQRIDLLRDQFDFEVELFWILIKIETILKKDIVPKNANSYYLY